MILGAIDFGQLGEVIWVSLVAGVGVTLTFSLVIYGSAQASEARRSNRRAAAIAHGALAGLAMLAVAAGVVFALTVILNKS